MVNCLSEGMQYEGHQVIMPGYTHSAESCQYQCSITYACSYFTWLAAPNSTMGILAPGGCLKFDNTAVAVAAPGPAQQTVSGAIACGDSLGAGTGSSTEAPTVTVSPATAVPTVPPTGTAVPTVPPTGTAVPTVPPIPPIGTLVPPIGTLVPPIGTPAPLPGVSLPGNGTALNTTNITGAVKENLTVDAGGGFPWWAILLLGFVVIGICAAVLFSMMGGSKKKSKRSGKVKKSKKESRQESAEMEGLMEGAVEQQALQAAPSNAPPVPEQAPLPALYSQQLAAPVATTTAFQQSNVAYMQPQGFVQMQQMPVMQPQFR